MIELPLLEVFHQSVQIVPDFIHQLRPESARLSDDRIFPNHSARHQFLRRADDRRLETSASADRVHGLQ